MMYKILEPFDPPDCTEEVEAQNIVNEGALSGRAFVITKARVKGTANE